MKINVTIPSPERIVTINVNHNDKLFMAFEPSLGDYARNGANLEISFHHGGRVVIAGYFAGHERLLPGFILADGTEVAGPEFLSGLNPAIMLDQADTTAWQDEHGFNAPHARGEECIVWDMGSAPELEADCGGVYSDVAWIQAGNKLLGIAADKLVMSVVPVFNYGAFAGEIDVELFSRVYHKNAMNEPVSELNFKYTVNGRYVGEHGLPGLFSQGGSLIVHVEEDGSGFGDAPCSTAQCELDASHLVRSSAGMAACAAGPGCFIFEPEASPARTATADSESSGYEDIARIGGAGLGIFAGGDVTEHVQDYALTDAENRVRAGTMYGQSLSVMEEEHAFINVLNAEQASVFGGPGGGLLNWGADNGLFYGSAGSDISYGGLEPGVSAGYSEVEPQGKDTITDFVTADDHLSFYSLLDEGQTLNDFFADNVTNLALNNVDHTLSFTITSGSLAKDVEIHFNPDDSGFIEAYSSFTEAGGNHDEQQAAMLSFLASISGI